MTAARSFTVPRIDRVVFGPGAFDRLAELVDDLGGRRVFVLMSASLVDSPVHTALRERLGSRLVGVYAGIRQHVPRTDVLAAADAARAEIADCLVSVGGGTPIDAAKAVAMCLATGIDSGEGFEDYRIRYTYPDTYEIPALPEALLPHIAVPTTLSGAEHTALAGVTDDRARVKGAHTAPGLMPRAVVLDPDVTAGTPGWLWAASGLRAIDHAVEGLLSARAMPFTDGLGLEALRLLAADLARSVERPDDRAARTNCLIGTWLSIFGLTNVGVGLSHGIGHQLAAEFDIVHGVTSAIMLPLVMEFTAEQTAPAQRRVAEALGVDVRAMDDRAAASAAVRAVRELIATLGVPHALSAVGARQDRLPAVAAAAMSDPAVASCPRPVTRADLEQLLLAAW